MKKMSKPEINLVKKTLFVAGICVLLSAVFFLMGTKQGIAVLSGVFLSSIFTISSAWVLHTFIDAENKVFVKAFFISMVVRFAVVLILFGILLELTKIDKIYFTVSFIISYLCQSVTEMIFINKILQKSGR